MTAPGLAKVTQTDFSGGMWHGSAPHLIPKNGTYDIVNGLLDEDGSIYRRGGSTLRSSGFGTALTFIWSGVLAGGQRTLIATNSAFGRVNADGSVTNLGGSGVGFPTRATVVNGLLVVGVGSTYDGTTLGAAAASATYYASAGGRLLAGQGDTASFSHRGDPATFDVADKQVLPDGVQIRGMFGVRNSCALFTTGGVWIWSNIHEDLVDASGTPLQSLDKYSSDLVLWAEAGRGDGGIAAWEGALVVPALDGVWVMSVGVASEAPQPFRRISDPIAGLYRTYVQTGTLFPGQACVYEGHYFLPIVDRNGSPYDLLVCRLKTGAWTRFSGYGGRLAGLTVGPDPSTSTPVLLAASGSSGRVLSPSYFSPGDSTTLDADGSTFSWSVMSRDVATGGFGQRAYVSRMRVWYEMSRQGGVAVLYSSFGFPSVVQSATTAPEDPFGTAPFSWQVGKRSRFLRWKLDCVDPTGTLKLRSVELFARPTGRP